MSKTPAAIAALAAAAVIALAGCQSGSDTKGTVASATANPTVAAELNQGKALVASCFPGTLLQQVRTVHLVFLSSVHGKHADEVTAARDKVFTCLHISDPAQRQAFVNDAGEAALHASPKLTTHAGRVQYFEITLPKIVLKDGGTAAGMGTSTAQPSIPGAPVSPSPAVTSPAATAGSPA
jgi:hypothetical protein